MIFLFYFYFFYKSIRVNSYILGADKNFVFEATVLKNLIFKIFQKL